MHFSHTISATRSPQCAEGKNLDGLQGNSVTLCSMNAATEIINLILSLKIMSVGYYSKGRYNDRLST